MSTFERRHMTVAEAQSLPRWQRPETLLYVMAAAMPIAFSTWVALLNNFIIDVAQFDGSDNGWLHTVREIPGFLAIGVIAILALIREQKMALIMLVLLGCATAVTAHFPTLGGILMVTFLSSIGFHFFETVYQSLQLQWIEKARAPHVLGRMIAVGSASTFTAYGLLVLLWEPLSLSYNTVFWISGMATVLIAVFCWFAYPQFDGPTVQRREMVLRKRYWLYYALQFMAGARRQIFVVFAGFMMVERFGYAVHEITALFLITLLVNTIFAPLMGAAVARFGERNTLCFEYIGLVGVFSAYGGLYFFGWGVAVAAALYVIDHLFFALAMALKTYFQKIADPADIAPTAAVAFTINHIAAVFLPAGLGYLWLVSPAAVFVMAAVMAGGSFCLALMIPRHPVPGHETIFSPVQAPAE